MHSRCSGILRQEIFSEKLGLLIYIYIHTYIRTHIYITYLENMETLLIVTDCSMSGMSDLFQ